MRIYHSPPATRLHQQSNKRHGYPTVSPHRLNHISGPTTPNTNNQPKRLEVHVPAWWLVSMLYHGRMLTGTRISTGCPSTTPDGLALGPDSPWEDELDPGTLSHPADRILTYQFVTHACILTRTHSTPPHGNASTHARRSPTHTHTRCIYAAASAVCLSPTTLSAQNHSTSELLRTLSRMAASKPTSWLSSRSHILFHLVHP